MDRQDIASFTYEEIQEEMKKIGEKPFRGRQIYEWIHVRSADDFSEMTNLSRELREKLSLHYRIPQMKVAAHQVSRKDPTEKFLFELEDGNMIESVLMKYEYGNSVCISSQAGCRMGCRFCASAIGGLKRSLLASEMLRQVYQVQKCCKERVSNIVVMGTGEPLDNYENFVRFVHMISDEHGLHISQRSITASTCGIVPGIQRLAGEGLQITLALSLHGSTQEKRKALMPVANKYALPEVLAACDYYFEKTGRRITFEYSLVKGVNDQPEDIRELTALLKHRNCHVNLIPVNPVKERTFRRPSYENAVEFKNKLEKNGINVTIRRERGSDIDGACGQLRRRYAADHKGETDEIICDD
ncbi:23S rRNA (adenine(2503)-C(2))-methyltransferase RlmN [uncultured Merdimonas sp.]|uniref:23S rRNA (adenine(2503)-C(2))-methyltransferase RlmN n=1 Tax=uncultured Merdimonas sp. TaxID=2023269 RepID=UPI003209EDAF